VAPISRFERESAAIDRANDTEHGLAAYIDTRDLARGIRVAAMVETGMIALNRGLMSDPGRPVRRRQAERHRTKAGKGAASPRSWRLNISPSRCR
jgi:acyl-CoA reductase-like NAD-dependent aldehyde dehydrogenase